MAMRIVFVAVAGLVIATAAAAAASPFQVKATISATQVTTWSAAQSGVTIPSLDDNCSAVADVAAQGTQEVRFSTPSPLVLGKQELVNQGTRSPLKTVTAVATRAGTSTMTFTGAYPGSSMTCSNGLCPVRAIYWFSFAFPDRSYASCSGPLVEDASACPAQTAQLTGSAFQLGWTSTWGRKELFLRLQAPRDFPKPDGQCPSVGTLQTHVDHASLGALTVEQLQQRLAHGPLTFSGSYSVTSSVTGAPPAGGTVGTTTTRWAWTVRLARA